MEETVKQEFQKLIHGISEEIVESNIDNAYLHFNLTKQLMEKQTMLIGDLLAFKDPQFFPILKWQKYKVYENDGKYLQKGCYSIESVRKEKADHDKSKG